MSSRERWLTLEEQQQREKQGRKAYAPNLTTSKQSFSTTFAPAARERPQSKPRQQREKASGISARGRTPTRRRPE